jgi:predicted RNase H-like HicB family nuclease
MAEIPSYSFAVWWSVEDEEWVATCLEIPGLSGLGDTADAALGELQTAIRAWLEHLQSEGIDAPKPGPAAGVVFYAVGSLEMTNLPIREPSTSIAVEPEAVERELPSIDYAEDPIRPSLR